MSKKKKFKPTKAGPTQTAPAGKPVITNEKGKILLSWILPILIVTGICFSPMLKNGFTNWDDEYYVTQNALLRGPDWAGIFSKPVVFNYHPITIATLAANYSMTGLEPSSYLISNLLLHLINTGLVFYFIWLISGKRSWVAAFSAIVFGIHPMHVESVAWISERKDVLYTLFFLLSLIQYWYFLTGKKNKNLIYCFLFFALSILSKPAAIILPLLLFLLDYWKGREYSSRLLIEKIPFFLVSVAFAIITVKVQSVGAIAGLDYYPLWTRSFFASYVSMIYLVRFFVPYPLSAFHPYPPPNDMGLPVLLSPVFMLALLVLIWFKRKNKLVVFSFLFYIINLLLVLQVITIGSTLVAERYTYVPYIGVAFFFGMLIDKYVISLNKKWIWGVISVVIVVFGFLTFQGTKVWKDSEVLWTNVLSHYWNVPGPRNSRANHLIRQSFIAGSKAKEQELLQRALEDCNVAVKAKPNYATSYENRQSIYLRLNKDSLALADARSLVKLEPGNRLGYYTIGVVYERFQVPDSAMKYYNKCLEVSPNADFAINSRGSLLFNHYKRYQEAMADFTKAIQISPNGDYYLNRSICHYQLGEMEKAKADALTAQQKGTLLNDSYRTMLQLGK